MCGGCSMLADQVAHLAHLNARDTTLVFVSRAPQADIERLKARMGWEMPWYTLTDDFDADFGVDEWHGTNAFIRLGDRVFRNYFVNSRGDEAMVGTRAYLDITALGRQEDWEDSPEGYPQTPPYTWWRWHDSYDDVGAATSPSEIGDGCPDRDRGRLRVGLEDGPLHPAIDGRLDEDEESPRRSRTSTSHASSPALSRRPEPGRTADAARVAVDVGEDLGEHRVGEDVAGEQRGGAEARSGRLDMPPPRTMTSGSRTLMTLARARARRSS